MNNKKYQIFVSSTYDDLRDERQAAVEAILKAGHIPAGMELFAAGDESQMETIRRWIESSDIYMLILGGRYGTIDPKTSLSYIELEYDYAVSLEKPVFAVVLNDKALDPKIKSEGKRVVETEHPQEYELFREKVLTKTCSFFDDCKDIKLSIHESIPDIRSRQDLIGWIPASDMPDTKVYINEIKRLSEENAELRQENENLQKQFERLPEGSKEREDYGELMKLLANIEIESVLFDKAQKIPKKRNLLDVFYITRDGLITGINNTFGMSDTHRFLYFNVLPKLQIHGLAINERVPGATWRRFTLTKKGLNLLSYIEKNRILTSKSSTTEVSNKSKTRKPGSYSSKHS